MPGLFSIQITDYSSAPEGNVVVSYAGDRRIRVELFTDEAEELLRQIEKTQEFKGIVARLKVLVNEAP
jgi:hypothetical protein